MAGAKSIVLAKEDLSEVQKLVGQVDDPASLLVALKRAFSVTIGEFKAELNEGQLKRLKSNAHFHDQSVEDFAQLQIKRGLVFSLGV